MSLRKRIKQKMAQLAMYRKIKNLPQHQQEEVLRTMLKGIIDQYKKALLNKNEKKLLKERGNAEKTILQLTEIYTITKDNGEQIQQTDLKQMTNDDILKLLESLYKKQEENL